MKLNKLNFDRKGERGNVLFLILIAVALFAALSYAVTQSSRSGGGDAGSETSLINSAAITQYPASIRTSILRMVVSSGVQPEELLFDPPPYTNLETNSVEEQGVFYPGVGGGATFAKAPGDVIASDSARDGTWYLMVTFAYTIWVRTQMEQAMK